MFHDLINRSKLENVHTKDTKDSPENKTYDSQINKEFTLFSDIKSEEFTFEDLKKLYEDPMHTQPEIQNELGMDQVCEILRNDSKSFYANDTIKEKQIKTETTILNTACNMNLTFINEYNNTDLMTKDMAVHYFNNYSSFEGLPDDELKIKREDDQYHTHMITNEVIDCDDSFPVEDKPIKEDDEEEDDDDDDDDEDEREIFSSSPADSSDEDFIKRTNHKRTLLKRASNNSSISKKGRKRRKRRNLLKPGSQLYQFILKLLDDEEKQNEIAWVCREEGIFRIIQKDIVAKRWGDFKERGMTYDSLSRGLRHYYQQGLLNSVNKKLHYQFTQKALEEWEEIRDKEFIDEKRGE